MRFDFEIGQEVYFRTDPQQQPNLITGIMIKQDGILYEVSFVNQSSWHYSFELSSERNILMACDVPVKSN